MTQAEALSSDQLQDSTEMYSTAGRDQPFLRPSDSLHGRKGVLTWSSGEATTSCFTPACARALRSCSTSCSLSRSLLSSSTAFPCMPEETSVGLHRSGVALSTMEILQHPICKLSIIRSQLWLILPIWTALRYTDSAGEAWKSWHGKSTHAADLQHAVLGLDIAHLLHLARQHVQALLHLVELLLPPLPVPLLCLHASRSTVSSTLYRRCQKAGAKR